MFPNGRTYKPGKRHWLKVKKDYLVGGSIADTADLVVLGAWWVLGIFLFKCFIYLNKLNFFF